MISPNRQCQIEELVSKINDFSEKYQLSHAIFAIEKLYKEKIQADCQERFACVREEAKKVASDDDDSIIVLNEQAEQIKKDSLRRIRIMIEYSSTLDDDSSRVTRSQDDVFSISLPKCMENIRTSTGVIDSKLLASCRKLVAHELGHIALHEGLFDEIRQIDEEEADCFADCLLALRKQEHAEIVLC